MQGLEINPKHDLVSSILQDYLVKGVVAGRTGEREDVMINNDLRINEKCLLCYLFQSLTGQTSLLQVSHFLS